MACWTLCDGFMQVINGLVLGLLQDCVGDLSALGAGRALWTDEAEPAIKVPSLKTTSAKNYAKLLAASISYVSIMIVCMWLI